jgi:hypothetical protein
VITFPTTALHQSPAFVAAFDCCAEVLMLEGVPPLPHTSPQHGALLLLLLFTAIEFSLGGSSPYTSNK